jgi:thioredoxin 1
METVLKVAVGILVGVAVFLLLLRILVIYRSRKLKGKRVSGFGSSKALIYFFSPKCGACEAMEKELSKLGPEIRVKRIDISKAENLSLARELGIVATPTILLLEGGTVKEVLVGFHRADNLKKLFHNVA